MAKLLWRNTTYLARCAGPAKRNFPMTLHLAGSQHVQLLRSQRVHPSSSWKYDKQSVQKRSPSSTKSNYFLACWFPRVFLITGAAPPPLFRAQTNEYLVEKIAHHLSESSRPLLLVCTHQQRKVKKVVYMYIHTSGLEELCFSYRRPPRVLPGAGQRRWPSRPTGTPPRPGGGRPSARAGPCGGRAGPRSEGSRAFPRGLRPCTKTVISSRDQKQRTRRVRRIVCAKSIGDFSFFTCTYVRVPVPVSVSVLVGETAREPRFVPFAGD